MNDDELRARLRAADPAASLPPATPDEVARLLEDAMSTDLNTRPGAGPEESRESGIRQRGPLTWLVAAAAAVVIAGAGLFAVLQGGEDSKTPTATPPSVTELSAPDAAAYAGRCAMPSAQLLGQASVAFAGTVSSIADGTAELQVTDWYSPGPSTDTVEVAAPSAAFQQLVQAVDFQVGDRYLVAATDGQVMVCGLSAPYSAGLAKLYEQAFA